MSYFASSSRRHSTTGFSQNQTRTQPLLLFARCLVGRFKRVRVASRGKKKEKREALRAFLRFHQRRLDTSLSQNVVVAETSDHNVGSFIILRSGEGLTPNKHTVLTFLVNHKYNEVFRGVPVLESKGP